MCVCVVCVHVCISRGCTPHVWPKRERGGERKGERITYAAYVTYSTVYIVMEVTLHE